MASHPDDLDQLLDSALDDFQTLNLKPTQGNEHKIVEDKGKKPSLPTNLRQQTREAVKNIESMSGGPKAGEDLSKDAMMEEWVKQFEELAGSQDMESMVETMMQQLLSKDILYEPMKEIGERYPKWLEDHKSSLSATDYERFSHQYELIQELNGVYDSDPGNFTRIVELMQKMQECGQPPSDIVSELTPDFDISSLGQLSPEMLEAQQNCCIM
ncbi:hypothetical protein KSS87_015314 [Heliosperma pusillum]|nr:hypothetical protein KSS87_015314 [Heliosperma pusillum]